MSIQCVHNIKTVSLTKVNVKDNPKLIDLFEEIQNDHHKYLRGIKKILKHIQKKYDLNEKENKALDSIVYSIDTQIKDEKKTIKLAKQEI